MKRNFYHGTSLDNLQSILSHGLSTSENKLWNCSNDEIYLWCPNAVAAGDCDEDAEMSEKEERAFTKACESAQFAAIMAKDCRLIVLKIELEDDEVSADVSCENMEGQGAVCIDRDILPSEIVEIKISNDLSLIRGYFMAMALNNEYSVIELSKTEKKIAKAMAEAIYIEDVEDMIEWEILQPA